MNDNVDAFLEDFDVIYDTNFYQIAKMGDKYPTYWIITQDGRMVQGMIAVSITSEELGRIMDANGSMDVVSPLLEARAKGYLKLASRKKNEDVGMSLK